MGNDGIIETLEDSFLDIIRSSVEFLPKLLVALLLLLVGVVLARFIAKIIGKVVDYVENSKPVVKSLNELGVKAIDIDGVVSIFVRWAIILVFLGAAVDVLGLPALTNTFDSLIDFIPNIFAAVIIAGLTFVAGNALRDVVGKTASSAGIAIHNGLAQTTKIVVLVFGFPLAAAQLGLDLTIITNNLTVIVGGIMLALGLAFGLGGKETAGKIVSDIHKNWKK